MQCDADNPIKDLEVELDHFKEFDPMLLYKKEIVSGELHSFRQRSHSNNLCFHQQKHSLLCFGWR